MHRTVTTFAGWQRLVLLGCVVAMCFCWAKAAVRIHDPAPYLPLVAATAIGPLSAASQVSERLRVNEPPGGRAFSPGGATRALVERLPTYSSRAPSATAPLSLVPPWTSAWEHAGAAARASFSPPVPTTNWGGRRPAKSRAWKKWLCPDTIRRTLGVWKTDTSREPADSTRLGRFPPRPAPRSRCALATLRSARATQRMPWLQALSVGRCGLVSAPQSVPPPVRDPARSAEVGTARETES